MDTHAPSLPIARPLQEGDPISKNWRRINELQEAIENHGIKVKATHQEISDRPRHSVQGFDLFPFCIYHFPNLRRTSESADDWRRVCVRAGTVFVDWSEVTATGTDGETFPDADEIPETSGHGTNEILCDAGVAKYWIWLEITSTTATVNHGATAPAWSSATVPIGWVDTSDTTNSQAFIRQLLRTDFFTCL